MLLNRNEARIILAADDLMYKLIGYLFDGPETGYKPSEVQATNYNRTLTSRITCATHSPIYRFLEHYEVDYNSLYTAWLYSISKHYLIEDILRLRYLENTSLKAISEILETSYSTAIYYHQVGTKRFLSSYAQQTNSRIPALMPDDSTLNDIKKLLDDDKIC